MRTPEQNFWASIKSHKPRDVWLQRVENELGYGMPDVYVCFRTGRSIWIELKVLDRPSKTTTPPFNRTTLRLQQINWHLKAATFKVASAVVARMDNELIIVHGSLVMEVHRIPGNEVFNSYTVTWDDFWKRLESYAN